jgi:ribA/ribD-fused uncharacterized protein
MDYYCGFFGPASPFSNMHRSPFVIDGVEYSCVEQWMQSQKAVVFGDHRVLSLIMDEKDPKKMKRLGRSVTPFNKDTWAGMAEDIVRKGLVAKFQSSPRLRDLLLLTGNKIIVECSPRDRLWGAGIGVVTLNKMAQEGSVKLRGKNLLGKLLMEVRDSIGIR